MRPLSVKKYISTLVAVAALLFSLTTPLIIEAHKCACASGDKSTDVDTSVAVFETSATPACCCADECAPMPVYGISLGDVVDRDCMDIHPPCCCASESSPLPVVAQSFIKDDRRPSFTDFQFQLSLPSAFMPPVHNFLFCAAFAFERDLERIPPHISSTILLI
jgi:hypothetical protein